MFLKLDSHVTLAPELAGEMRQSDWGIGIINFPNLPDNKNFSLHLLSISTQLLFFSCKYPHAWAPYTFYSIIPTLHQHFSHKQTRNRATEEKG
jgi:hypothetical protein